MMYRPSAPGPPPSTAEFPSTSLPSSPTQTTTYDGLRCLGCAAGVRVACRNGLHCGLFKPHGRSDVFIRICGSVQIVGRPQVSSFVVRVRSTVTRGEGFRMPLGG